MTDPAMKRDLRERPASLKERLKDQLEEVTKDAAERPDDYAEQAKVPAGGE